MTSEQPPTWQYATDASGVQASADGPLYVPPAADERAADFEPTTVVQTPVLDDGADDEGQGKAGAAKEQAAAVGQGAAQAGQQVASVAKDQAQNVAAEAGSQAKDLVGQARDELTAQASTQQKRLAETLHALGDELQSMSQHDGEKSTATDLVSQASTRSHDAGSWLESREPGHLLSDVQDFARRRPGTFLAVAAVAGLAAGRLGRGVKDSTDDDTATATGGHDPAPTTVTRADSAAAAPAYEPANLDAQDRPFASSQDAGYPYDGGSGL